MSLSAKERVQIVEMYNNGHSASVLCATHSVAKSTLYYWVHQYRRLQTVTDNTVYYKEYVELKRHAEKLEMQLAVLKRYFPEDYTPKQMEEVMVSLLEKWFKGAV